MSSRAVEGPDTTAYTEARSFIRKALGQAEAMRRALEQSMDVPGGMAWEEEIGGPAEPREPEVTPETTPPMEEPKGLWQRRRLELLRAQMRKNWPSQKAPPRRRPWRSR